MPQKEILLLRALPMLLQKHDAAIPVRAKPAALVHLRRATVLVTCAWRRRATNGETQRLACMREDKAAHWRKEIVPVLAAKPIKCQTQRLFHYDQLVDGVNG